MHNLEEQDSYRCEDSYSRPIDMAKSHDNNRLGRSYTGYDWIDDCMSHLVMDRRSVQTQSQMWGISILTKRKEFYSNLAFTKKTRRTDSRGSILLTFIAGNRYFCTMHDAFTLLFWIQFMITQSPSRYHIPCPCSFQYSVHETFCTIILPMYSLSTLLSFFWLFWLWEWALLCGLSIGGYISKNIHFSTPR